MEKILASFRIEIARESRWVECVSFDGGSRFESIGNPFLARVGRSGSKLWPSSMNIWKRPDGSYRPSLSAVHLNRQAEIVAWNKPEVKDQYISHHNSAASKTSGCESPQGPPK